ncbi:MAG: hypothetical protein WBQ21_00710 [Solirubrobacteraceae bacterium]
MSTIEVTHFTDPGCPTEFQGKAAQSDGPVRYTAPSLILRAGDAR